jgi:shikimate dehydrogenase
VEYARRELNGFNVTVPHKNAIIPFLDEISTEASLAGSVNTVSVRNGKLCGTSTDGYGLAEAMREAFGKDVRNSSFCFLGSGGVVRAVAFYFAHNGADRIFFVNRTPAKAEKLSQDISAEFPEVDTAFCQLADEITAKKFLSSADVVIQGTSLGLKPDDPPPIKPEFLTPDNCFFETVYKSTRLLEYAIQNGIKHADGSGMLIHQGAESFYLWTGVRPDINVMRKTLDNAMKKRNG